MARHTAEINKVYEPLIHCMLRASIDCHHSIKEGHYKNVAGWSEHFEEFCIAAKKSFLKWMQDGRIKEGNLFDDMKSKRANFKKNLRYYSNN